MAINFTLSQCNECVLLVIAAAKRHMTMKASKVGEKWTGKKNIFCQTLINISCYTILFKNTANFCSICKIPLHQTIVVYALRITLFLFCRLCSKLKAHYKISKKPAKFSSCTYLTFSVATLRVKHCKVKYLIQETKPKTTI